MEIGEVFYPKTRSQWRRWLNRNHAKKTEIWVRRFKKGTGKPSINYDDLVEECLCFGWIDSTIKKLDDTSNVQRITPRRKKSFLSELNRQRAWKMQAAGLMTESGLAPIRDQLGTPQDPWKVPTWLKKRLREEPAVWKAFSSFPYLYQRLKIGWIVEAGESRPEEMERRLAYLIKCTRAGKMYGTVPISEDPSVSG